MLAQGLRRPRATALRRYRHLPPTEPEDQVYPESRRLGCDGVFRHELIGGGAPELAMGLLLDLDRNGMAIEGDPDI